MLRVQGPPPALYIATIPGGERRGLSCRLLQLADLTGRNHVNEDVPFRFLEGNEVAFLANVDRVTIDDDFGTGPPESRSSRRVRARGQSADARSERKIGVPPTRNRESAIPSRPAVRLARPG